MSKVDYCNVLFKGLPKYQIQRGNKLIQAFARFVKYKYGELKDIADLNWLVIEERIDFTLMKLVFNGLNNKNMSEDLQLKLSEEKRSLRKNSVMLVHQNETLSQRVCVCVCVCVCVYTLPPVGFFRLHDVCDIREKFGSTMFCCEY